MLQQSGRDTLDIAMKNRHRGWMGENKESAETRIKSAALFKIAHTPKFPLDPSQPIFTMGSCFARRIEDALIRAGVPLALDGYGISPDRFTNWNPETLTGGGMHISQLSRGALNKFSVHSMTAEVFRVLNNTPYENEGLFEVRDGLWHDPQSSGLKPAPFAEAMDNRRRIFDAMSQIRKAETVVLTLGLTESWTDTTTGIVMNGILSGLDLRKHQDRFEFTNHGYDEILAELWKLIRVVREACNPSMKFIITVSPVPLGLTFTDLDVMVANTCSKSTLRAVAAALHASDPLVDYFPSYEYVTLSPRELAWRDDQLHVAPGMVSHITTQFIAAYMPEKAETP